MTMEQEIISRGTPATRQPISRTREVSKRLRAIAKTPHSPFAGETHPMGRMSANGPVHQAPRFEGHLGLGHCPLHPNRSKNTPPLTDYGKRIIGNMAFARGGILLPFPLSLSL